MKQLLTIKNTMAFIFIVATIVSIYKTKEGHPETASAAGSIAAAIIAAAGLIGFVLIHINETNRK